MVAIHTNILKIKRGITEIEKTYALIRKLASINGSNISESLLDRVMYNVESLPPLGKEYWWFLFFGQERKQIMLLVFRKFGKKMIFNDREMLLKKMDVNEFQAITAGWIYDGEKMRDLGDANPIITVNPEEKTLVSRFSNRKMTLHGGFPNYGIKIEGIIDLRTTMGWFPENKCAHGVFIPPFGAGWVDIYSNVEGTVLGDEFRGNAHLQKVVGIMPYGPFHWGRVVFQKGSVASFFCLKTGRGSRRYFHRSMAFYDHEGRKTIRFENPELKIVKNEGKKLTWIIEGQDNEKKLRMVLEVYATKSFTMKGGGFQVYIEYAVTPKEFSLRTRDQVITLSDLGKGVGTFEDAYWSSI